MMAGRMISRTAVLPEGELRVDESYSYIYDDGSLLAGQPVGVELVERAAYLSGELITDPARVSFLAEKADLLVPALIRDFSEGRV